MLKRKDMKRTEWRRILKRAFFWQKCSYQNQQGIASVLILQEVSEPLTVHEEHGDVTIANEGDTWLQIAFENTCYWVTAMYNSWNELVQIYFDITNGSDFSNRENPTFEDLFLDIVMEADGTLHVLDRDELDTALNEGIITVQQHQKAVSECEKLFSYLRADWKPFSDFCHEQMLQLKKETYENGKTGAR